MSDRMNIIDMEYSPKETHDISESEATYDTAVTVKPSVDIDDGFGDVPPDEIWNDIRENPETLKIIFEGQEARSE